MPSVSEPAIVVEDLGKRFGDVVAVDGVDLTVPAGTVLGLLGPNGAGKTTTVRILTTILRPDAGRATVLGLDVASDPEAVRAIIGLAGQYAAVDENLTGRENLRMVGQLTHQRKVLIAPRADELLERFGLADAADRPVRTYSGGMRRRLDLAAALVHRPPVLFLDEPTTGLDPRGRSDLWAVIERAGGRRHDLAADHAVPGGGRPPGRQHRGHRRRAGSSPRGPRRSSSSAWAPPSSRCAWPTRPRPSGPARAGRRRCRPRCSTTGGPWP